MYAKDFRAQSDFWINDVGDHSLSHLTARIRGGSSTSMLGQSGHELNIFAAAECIGKLDSASNDGSTISAQSCRKLKLLMGSEPTTPSFFVRGN